MQVFLEHTAKITAVQRHIISNIFDRYDILVILLYKLNSLIDMYVFTGKVGFVLDISRSAE